MTEFRPREVVRPVRLRGRIAFRCGAVTRFIEPSAVDRLEGSGAYVRVHESGRSFLVRGTLDELARRLGVDAFVRVHRSCVVSIRAIVELRRDRAGKLRAILASGASVHVTRMTREQLERMIEQT